MSFQSAKQFIIDFYANPIIRMQIYKIQQKKLNREEQISKILSFAKNNGYDFSVFDLIKAARFKQQIQKLQKNELNRVFGGNCLNYDKLNKLHKKGQTIEQMLTIF